jgi:hypothetical protein
VSGHLPHVTGLHRAAESSPQFVSAGLDDRVMRDAHDRAVDAIQGDRDTSGLLQQLVQFFLKRRRRFVHESASAGRDWVPKVPSGRTLSQNRQVPLLTFCTRQQSAQKLACTRVLRPFEIGLPWIVGVA